MPVYPKMVQGQKRRYQRELKEPGYTSVEKGRYTRSAQHEERLLFLAPIFREIHAEGITSTRKTASALNKRGLKSPFGRAFSQATTRRYMRLLEERGLYPKLNDPQNT